MEDHKFMPMNADKQISQPKVAKSETHEERTRRLKWWILLTVIVGTFLGRLDQTIVNLALPKIINDFGITVSAAGWIATAYILANAVFVPIWGKLGDTLGRKKIYILGFTIFIFGSILAGLAWNLNSMIIFRIIQAIAGSADYPTAMAIIAVTFREAKDRAQALGLWSASFAAATVFGPLIGGPLIDNFGWRSVFLINLPVGIIGLIMAIIFIEESTSLKKTVNFDWWGAITLGVALSTLVLVLDKGIDWGWLSVNAWICYAITVIFAVIFYNIDKNHPEPIVDFKFFQHSIFVQSLLNNFLVFMSLMGGVFLVPLFCQTFLGMDATQTGYMFIPMAGSMMIAAAIGGALTGKLKPNIIIAASTLIGGIGIYMFTWIDARSTFMDIMLPLAVMAFGIGFGMAQRTNIIASVVDPHEIGIASSILALARNIAGAFGIAFFATILNNSIESSVIKLAHNTVINAKSALVYQQVVGLVILKAQIMGYRTVFLIAAIVLVIGAVAALFISVKGENKKVEIMID